MRKFFYALSVLLMLGTSVSFARGGLFDDGGAGTNRHQFGIEASVGRASFDNSGVGFTGGMRYQYNLHRFVGLDLLGVNYMGNTVKNVGYGPSVLQGLVGARFNSPDFYQDISMYAGVRIGGGYDFYLERGGFSSEINVGIKITPHVTFGYVMNIQKLNSDDSFNWEKYGLTDQSYKNNFAGALWKDLSDNVRKARLDYNTGKYIYHGFKVGFIF